MKFDVKKFFVVEFFKKPLEIQPQISSQQWLPNQIQCITRKKTRSITVRSGFLLSADEKGYLNRQHFFTAKKVVTGRIFFS